MASLYACSVTLVQHSTTAGVGLHVANVGPGAAVICEAIPATSFVDPGEMARVFASPVPRAVGPPTVSSSISSRNLFRPPPVERLDPLHC